MMNFTSSLILPRSSFPPAGGLGRTTVDNGSDRQKGARRYPLDLTDEKTAVGITAMQSESKLRTSRRIIRLYRNRSTCTGYSNEPFKPLNLTYSLVKELISPNCFDKMSRRTRVSVSLVNGKLIRVRLC